ncbi:MEDS domain-containing protein [Catenuloplanes atrovinosus]|uniref:ABC-type transporter Mla MlaB component n=1 Tax=Catenuloplanes atrovinosus TaxID=137266 RepID=A0AAE3YK16_9ACTN|nr:MEDS domain-containing protein [Catenuloplanes atrovinosus]MDR7275194.1 ABC-type transporter Mla MlaB component [Catenuloplanes atrovinosus]
MVETLRPGDHVCWTVGTDDEQLDVTARFIADGLARRHRIVYFTHSLLPLAVSAGLTARGVPVARAVADGQLRITPSSGGYLATGRFDASAMPGAWAAEQDAARAAGWSGLRAIGDMAWAASRLPGAEDLAAYEARVNRVFAEGYAMALCLYDRRLFTAAELNPIMSAHPCAKGAADERGWRPALRMRVTATPPRLTLRGEIDASNRDAVAAMLETLAAESATVEVDLAGAAVFDVSTVTRLVRGAGTFRLVGQSPQVDRLIGLVGGGAR